MSQPEPLGCQFTSLWLQMTFERDLKPGFKSPALNSDKRLVSRAPSTRSQGVGLTFLELPPAISLLAPVTLIMPEAPSGGLDTTVSSLSPAALSFPPFSLSCRSIPIAETTPQPTGGPIVFHHDTHIYTFLKSPRLK